jgi:hypothetical protein
MISQSLGGFLNTASAGIGVIALHAAVFLAAHI